MRSAPARLLLALLATASTTACLTSRAPAGSVLVRTSAGEEQGVATNFGIVFLARTAQAGRCDVTVFFGDGPSIEPGHVDPIEGSQLARAVLGLRVPWSEVSGTYPSPSDDLVLAVAEDQRVRTFSTRVADGPGVSGTLVERPSSFPLDGSAVGAGLFRWEDSRYRLVGLVTGVVRFQDASGSRRDLLTFLGPRDLAPLLLRDHERGRDRAFPARDDIDRR